MSSPGADLRLAFLGTPDPAVVTLRALLEAGHDVAIVVSRADARRGRRQEPAPSPVKAAALDLGLTVTERVDDVLGAGAELGVVVAYGRIIKPDVLAALPLVNVHFSLLPRWRGAAPVERAILAGDTTTGVTLMALDEGLDTGPVYRRAEVAIGEEETAAQLRSRLAALGATVVVDALAGGLGSPEPQVGEPTYAAKVTPADLELRWEQPARQLLRVVRVGRAWTTWRGRRLLVLAAKEVEAPSGPSDAGAAPGQLSGDVVATGYGALRLVSVRPEARPALDAAEWLRGARLDPGEGLG
ncbi:MAG: methionyl-tRNA formyltransferase [Acidimicrobiales bacterium]